MIAARSASHEVPITRSATPSPRLRRSASAHSAAISAGCPTEQAQPPAKTVIPRARASDTLNANTLNDPVEDIESHAPLRVTRYELREDHMPPGQWRGGIGTTREFTFLSDASFSIEGDGHAFKPWSLLGGADGHVASLTLVAPDLTPRALPSKVPYAR
ncbi:MAG: hydantoinase B/oxoprolinase family protein [Candidatus Saccharibacteria bacterium]|nr:hydantoinase B/oxoprolinase family protein [Pseudorhodobacter sp.]